MKLVTKTLAVFLTLSCAIMQAQKNDSTLLIGSFKETEGVRLKWIPADIDQFNLGAKNGYNVFRAKVTTDGNQISKGEFVKLNDSPILPWSDEKIQTEMQNDSTFDLVEAFLEFPQVVSEQNQPENLKQAVEADRELEYFSFFTTLLIFQKNTYASSLGYFYQDKTAQANTRYLYKVEVRDTDKYMVYTLIDTKNEQFNAEIANFSAKLREKIVSLKWYNNQSRDYVAYNIYRSKKENGTYEKMNDITYMSNGGAASQDRNYSYYSDSIPEYGKTYYYKIRGVNPFGEEGPETKPIEILTYKTLTKGITLNDGEDLREEGIKLSWVYNEEDKSSIDHVDIYHSEDSDGLFTKINDKPISAKKSVYMDTKRRWHSNYYIAYAYGLGGDSLRTITKQFLLEDSIPPVKPEFIDITCDTNGIVTAVWKNNKERDLYGYRLYRTYDRSSEPRRMHVSALVDTVFTDSVDLEAGYNKVFYRLHAIDEMYNPSLPTEYFHVILPDKIAPNSGYFTSYDISFDGIKLTWQKPSDFDLKSLTLYRKAENDFGYYPHVVLSGDSLTSSVLLDTAVKANLSYDYFLQAEDEAGLLSEQSKHLYLIMMDNTKIPSVENLEALVSRENAAIKLSWELKANAVGYQLLRTDKNNKLEKYDYISGNVREYYDRYLRPNTEYTYKIIADLETGFTSGPSKKLKVKY